MQPLKCLSAGALTVLAVGCSSASEGVSSSGARGRGTPAGVAALGGGGVGAHGAAASGFAGSLSQTATFVNYESLAAGSGSAGAAANGAIPAGCEVGMFCAPQSADSNCGTLSLAQDVQVERKPGNLLLVFDQSASMQEPWGTVGLSKLQAAQQALTNAITTLQDSLTVGAIFFPTSACLAGLPPPAEGVVAPIDGPGQIPFQPGPTFLQNWTAHFAQPGAGRGLGTPMQEAFDRADAALSAAAVTGATAVVAVTDGQPNCLPGPMAMTALEVDHASNWLSTKSIKTYVVGLPGAAGVQLLNDVATSGGTMQYIVPDDPAALEAKLKEVVQEQVKTRFMSCAIKLSPAADPPEKLAMVVVEAAGGGQSSVPHQVSATSGWSISADGSQAELTGDLCTEAMNGRFASITFEYPCKELPPLMPIIPS